MESLWSFFFWRVADAEATQATGSLCSEASFSEAEGGAGRMASCLSSFSVTQVSHLIYAEGGGEVGTSARIFFADGGVAEPSFSVTQVSHNCQEKVRRHINPKHRVLL